MNTIKKTAASVLGGSLLGIALVSGAGAAMAGPGWHVPGTNGGYFHGPYASQGDCNNAHRAAERTYTLELNPCVRASNGKWVFYARYGA